MTEDVTVLGRRAADLIEMLAADELDIGFIASSYLAGSVPSLGVLDLPFPIADRDRIRAALDGAVGVRLSEDVAGATPYRVLAFWDNGFRHISNRLRPIRHPRDCRGMRIRTLDNAFHHALFRAFGFEPVTIDVRNLAEAVASHAVDAQENPLTNLVNFNLHRVHRHVSLTGHFFGVVLLLANRKRFEAWPADAQRAIMAACGEATQTQRQLATAEDARCLEQLRREGIEIVGADAIDRRAFRQVIAEVIERETVRIGAGLVAQFARADLPP
jgi:TRAP-type C4-dicarboxylate transport system substrate-binding protein